MSNWKRGLPLGSNSAPSEKRRGTWHAPRPQKWARIATKPVWFQPEDFRRVPVSAIGLTAPHLRRLHTSGLPGPRSRDKRTIHQNLRLISPFSKTQPYGASGKGSSPPKPENDARSPIGRPFAARAWPIAGGPQFAGKSTTPPRTGSSIRWCTDRRPVSGSAPPFPAWRSDRTSK